MGLEEFRFSDFGCFTGYSVDGLRIFQGVVGDAGGLWSFGCEVPGEVLTSGWHLWMLG